MKTSLECFPGLGLSNCSPRRHPGYVAYRQSPVSGVVCARLRSGRRRSDTPRGVFPLPRPGRCLSPALSWPSTGICTSAGTFCALPPTRFSRRSHEAGLVCPSCRCTVATCTQIACTYGHVCPRVSDTYILSSSIFNASS